MMKCEKENTKSTMGNLGEKAMDRNNMSGDALLQRGARFRAQKEKARTRNIYSRGRYYNDA